MKQRVQSGPDPPIEMIASRFTRESGRVPVPASEERELVNRMRSGDETAFEEFANHYIPALYRFAASRLGAERELARDIVGATMCKVIEKLDSYRGEAPLFTWLCACCRNEIAGHYRRSRGEAALEDLDSESFAATTASPQEELLEEEGDRLVHLALDHLPPRYALVLEWKYLQGSSVNEIAARLNLSVKAAESLLTRARSAFREVYERIAHPVEQKR